MRLTPATVRIIPFALYIGFLILESALPRVCENFHVQWLYAVKVGAVAIALAILWSRYGELSAPQGVRSFDWMLSAFGGILIFVLWILLDQPWAMLGAPPGWSPVGLNGEKNWVLIAARIVGAVIVVPVMEELFWRSLVMRWIRAHAFQTVVPAEVGATALLVSSTLFALEHHQWLAGFLAGLAYGVIYMRSGNLWTAVLSHAITNLLLGLWVLYTEQWQFW
jgi:CAAX protease family protein